MTYCSQSNTMVYLPCPRNVLICFLSTQLSNKGSTSQSKKTHPCWVPTAACVGGYLDRDQACRRNSPGFCSVVARENLTTHGGFMDGIFTLWDFQESKEPTLPEFPKIDIFAHENGWLKNASFPFGGQCLFQGRYSRINWVEVIIQVNGVNGWS